MPLLLGYNISTSAASGADPVRDAQAAEAMGFDFVSASDHLHGTHPTLETWTMLTWVAAGTERVGLVPNVLGAPYRAPAVTAKMAETLHRLSGGRLVLGMGAGGMDAEFEAFGLTVGKGAEKVAAFDEALEAMRLLWAGPDANMAGRHHRLAGATITPRPERPIPVWVGAYGPKMLELVGRRADGWLPSMPFVGPDRLGELRDRVRRSAEAAGRDPDSLTYAYNVGVHVGDRIDDKPLVSGSVEDVAEVLLGFTAIGVDAINVWPAGDEAVQRARLPELVPLLRAG